MYRVQLEKDMVMICRERDHIESENVILPASDARLQETDS